VWVEREGVDEVFGACSHVGRGVSAPVCTCLWLFVCSRGRVRERERACAGAFHVATAPTAHCMKSDLLKFLVK